VAPSPLVSVVIPVYNRADCVRLSIESALAQTLQPIEVIVVDDASTDGTVEAVRAAVARAPDRVRLIVLERNGGCSVARNAGVLEARAPLLAFLDSDDLWSPDKLALQVADLERYPRAVLSFTDCLMGPRALEEPFSEKVPFDAQGDATAQLLEGCPILTPSSVLLSRAIFDAVGGFTPSYRTSEDFELYLRLSARGPFRNLPLPLTRRVLRADSLWRSDGGSTAAAEATLAAFLARPEGRAYRGRRRELRAFAHFSLGVVNLLMGDPARGAREVAAALALDPVTALRRPRGRALLLKLAAALAGRALGPFVPDARRRAVRRVYHRLLALVQGRAADPPAGVSFRPPPDMPV